MKTLTTKLLAVCFIFALATGCASVTDAGLDMPEDPTASEQVMPPLGDPFGETDVQPIVPKPNSGE